LPASERAFDTTTSSLPASERAIFFVAAIEDAPVKPGHDEKRELQT
jgi:hypothetical protein